MVSSAFVHYQRPDSQALWTSSIAGLVSGDGSSDSLDSARVAMPSELLVPCFPVEPTRNPCELPTLPVPSRCRRWPDGDKCPVVWFPKAGQVSAESSNKVLRRYS
jgi:hypothetical protein